jgi:hypothetical protein
VLVPLRFYEMTYRGGMVILGVTPDEMMAQTVRCLTKEDRYKNELVLFSLKDWVMDKWEDYRKYQLKQNMPYHARGHPVAEITRGAVREITSNIFSVS